SGSIVVNYTIKIDNRNTSEYVNAIVAALKYLSNHTDFKIDDTKVNLTSMTIEGKE
ncbi:hypothetical protein Bpfe_010516, partial [Biomphalaria pfeifferi]